MKKNELIKIKEQFEDVVLDIRKIGDDIMFSCNSVVEKFGRSKRPSNFLRTNHAKEYINDMMRGSNMRHEDIVFVKQSGKSDEQGTWMHYELFIEYLRTVNIPFARWTNKITIKLLTQGYVNLNEELELLKNENNKLKSTNKTLLHFGNIVANSLETISVNEFSALVDMSVQELNNYLRETNRLQKFKDKPYQKEIDNGNFKYNMQFINGRIIPTTKITPKLQLKLFEELI